MSNQITTAFVKEFSDGLEMLVQQRGSRLRSAVRVETGVRAKAAFFDQIGATEAVEVTTRHADSPLIETPHARRMVTMKNIEWGDMIDDFDRVQVLNDPASAYVQNAGWAVGRKVDDVIIAAFFATAKTGEEGTVDVSFPTATNQIAADFDGDGTAEGLTVAKLREVRKKFLQAEALMSDDEVIHMAVSAQQLDDLLATTEATSIEFNSVRALVNGQVNQFLGIEFHRSERLLLSSTNRRCPAWVRNGMLLAVGIEPRARITERSDKRYSWYAYWSARFGATRMQEEKVLEVLCSEA